MDDPQRQGYNPLLSKLCRFDLSIINDSQLQDASVYSTDVILPIDVLVSVNNSNNYAVVANEFLVLLRINLSNLSNQQSGNLFYKRIEDIPDQSNLVQDMIVPVEFETKPRINDDVLENTCYVEGSMALAWNSFVKPESHIP